MESQKEGYPRREADFACSASPYIKTRSPQTDGTREYCYEPITVLILFLKKQEINK